MFRFEIIIIRPVLDSVMYQYFFLELPRMALYVGYMISVFSKFKYDYSLLSNIQRED
jgi:hypothetical protein